MPHLILIRPSRPSSALRDWLHALDSYQNATSGAPR
jgi:hypothetical protein